MKKAIYCLLCLSIFTFMLTGCGDNQIDKPITSSSENSSELSSQTSQQITSVEQEMPIKTITKEDILKIKENTKIQQILDAWGETRLTSDTTDATNPRFYHAFQIENDKEFTFAFSSYEAVYPYSGEMILKIIEKTGALSWLHSLEQQSKVVNESKTARTFEYTASGATTSDFVDLNEEKQQYTYRFTFPKPIYIESSIIMIPFQTYEEIFNGDAMKIGGLQSVIKMENITTIPNQTLLEDGYSGKKDIVSRNKYTDKNGNTVYFLKEGGKTMYGGDAPVETIYIYEYYIQTPGNLVVSLYFYSRTENDIDNEKMFQEIVDSFEFVK